MSSKIEEIIENIENIDKLNNCPFGQCPTIPGGGALLTCQDCWRRALEEVRQEAFAQILMYLADASLAQSGDCYECTQELIRIIEGMEARDTNVLTKNGGELE